MKSNTIMSLSEARKRIFEIAGKVQEPEVYFTLTEKGQRKVIIMSADEFDSLMETMELLGDPELMKEIEEAEKEYKNGEIYSWDEVKQQLRLVEMPQLLRDQPLTLYKYQAKKRKSIKSKKKK